MKLVAALLVVSAFGLTASARADFLVLKDGTVLKGSTIVETKTEVTIKGGFGDLPFDKSAVFRIVRGVKSEEGACPLCLGSSRIPCGDCDGTRRAFGACVKCKGVGSFVCKHCKGDGKKMCKNCNGHGEVRVRLRYGGYVKRKCRTCQGFGFLYCGRCMVDEEKKKPTGREKCSRCKGDGAAPCKRCDREGLIACVYCGGTGTRADDREFYLPSWRCHRDAWKAPEKTALQRQEFWKWSQDKVVFWPGTVVEAGRDSRGVFLQLNTDKTSVNTVKGKNGRILTSLAGNVFAYMAEGEEGVAGALKKGDRIWVSGKISSTVPTQNAPCGGAGELALKETKIFFENRRMK
jgi:hypothetical protein